MNIEELATRLGALEADQAARLQAEKEQQFMDMYGTRFSNDRNIGLAILGEMSRRGIDVSAADDAVQQILDGIRAEATDILNKIQQHQVEVDSLVDKVNNMSDAVAAATGDGEPTIPNIEPEPMPEVPPVEEPPAPPAPPVEEPPAPPVEEPPAPPVEEPPANVIPSDERLKNIRAKAKNSSARHILSALKGSL